ncbi:MAG: hypothetical protein AB1758_16605 [Candidatus Eremiobacterota bacterium]
MLRWLKGGGGDPNEAQSLRLELEERTRVLDEARRELERLRLVAERAGAEAAGLEGLFEDLATPVQQLALQASLLASGVDVRPEDLCSVSGRLLQALARGGLEVVGQRGEEASFDPNQHQPMGDGRPRSGEAVRVRIPAVSLKGRILRKAMVETT